MNVIFKFNKKIYKNGLKLITFLWISCKKFL